MSLKETTSTTFVSGAVKFLNEPYKIHLDRVQPKFTCSIFEFQGLLPDLLVRFKIGYKRTRCKIRRSL